MPAQEEPSAENRLLSIVVRLPEDLGTMDVVLQQGASVQDVRQVVYDSPRSQFHTCFYLAFDGARLPESADITSVKGIAAGSVLAVVPDKYTERDVHVHIKRLRDSLVGIKSAPDALCIDAASTFLSSIEPNAIAARERLERFFPNEVAKEEPADAANHNQHSKSSPEPQASKSKKKKKNNKQKSEKPKQPSAESFFAAARSDLAACIDRSLLDRSAAASTSAFAPASFRKQTPKCINSLAISAWSPAPRNRKMAGDILYLSVTTLEGESFDVTASVSGFFINGSTCSSFDPLPRQNRPCTSHTLLGLLSHASPRFVERFSELQSHLSSFHPIEFFAAPHPSRPWIVLPEEHTPDSSRLLNTIFDASTVIESGASRDWNEDIQTARELPGETQEERIVRDQAMYRVHSEFVDAAMRSVVGIVDGTISTTMALGDDNNAPSSSESPAVESQMYVHNGMFISEGVDNLELLAPYGGLEATRVALSKDIDGLRKFNSLEIDGVSAAGTVVVDYMGRRFVVQTIIPGLLNRPGNQELQLKYGSLDGGKEIFSDPEYEKAFSAVASGMHLEPHKVVDAKGETHSLVTSIDTKGITGTDGRLYIVDLYRTTPVDVQFLERVFGTAEVSMDDVHDNATDEHPYPHKFTFVRHELVSHFFENKVRVALREHHEKHPEAHLGHDETAKNETENAETGEPQQDGEKEEKKREPTLIELHVTFNPDAFTHIQSADEPDRVDRQHTLIRELSSYISVMICQMVAELRDYPSMIPLDRESLVRMMHRRGINMRYLGEIVDTIDAQIKCANVDNTDDKSAATNETFSPAMLYYPRTLCVQEMIIRAAKHILRNLLRDIPLFHAGACISHFLNCFFANDDNAGVVSPPVCEAARMLASVSKPALSDMDAIKTPELAFMAMTPESLHADIIEQVSRRFRYDLVQDLSMGKQFWAKRKVAFLRGLAMSVGFQLRQRDYGLLETACKSACGGAASLMFAPEDVVSVYPLIKHTNPRSAFADKAFEHSRMLLARNSAAKNTEETEGENPADSEKSMGMELLQETVAIYDQVFGPVHPDAVAAVSHLALSQYHVSGDAETARFLQQRAVVSHERVYGNDAAETLQQYLHLAYFEFCCGYRVVAVKYLLHALKMWRLLEGDSVHDMDGVVGNGKDDAELPVAAHDAAAAPESTMRHPESIVLYTNIAKMLQRLGGDLIRGAIESCVPAKSEGDASPQPPAVLTPAAESEQKQGYHYLVLSAHFYALAARLAMHLFGKTHPGTAIAYESLALCHHEIGSIASTYPSTLITPSVLHACSASGNHMRRALAAQKTACACISSRSNGSTAAPVELSEKQSSSGTQTDRFVVAEYMLKRLTTRAVEEAKIQKMLTNVTKSN